MGSDFSIVSMPFFIYMNVLKDMMVCGVISMHIFGGRHAKIRITLCIIYKILCILRAFIEEIRSLKASQERGLVS